MRPSDRGSVSRLAGSAHRWVELYAGVRQRKTTQSQTDCSGNGNNPGGGHLPPLNVPRQKPATPAKAWEAFLVLLVCAGHGRYGAGGQPARRLLAVSVVFVLFRHAAAATPLQHRNHNPQQAVQHL